MFFKKKKKSLELKPLLYQKYLTDRNANNSMESSADLDIHNTTEDITVSTESSKTDQLNLDLQTAEAQKNEKTNNSNKYMTKDTSEKKRRRRNKKKVNLTYVGNVSIAIMSLSDESAGCRHIILSFASFLIRNHKSVCIVNYGKDINTDICHVYRSKSEIVQGHSDYEFILYNIGNNSSFESEDFALATLKIVMCLYNDDFIRLLYDFVTKYDINYKYCYIFDFLSQKNFKKVYDLMEDYNNLCLPLYNLDNINVLDDVVTQILELL